MIGPRSIWNEATRMYSTWRSGESRGYCDLHRRTLVPGVPFSIDRRCTDLRALLGGRPMNDGEGDSLWASFVVVKPNDSPKPASLAAVRMGIVVAIVRGTDAAEDTAPGERFFLPSRHAHCRTWSRSDTRETLSFWYLSTAPRLRVSQSVVQGRAAIWLR